jgi:hypothetical protein
VERTVAADDDEQLGSLVDGARRELGQVAGRLGEERVAGEPLPRGDVRDLGPALARRPVRRRRVDEEDGLLNARP